MKRRRPTTNTRASGTFPAEWVLPVADLAELLPDRDATAVRCQLHARQLVDAHGLVDLADTHVGHALGLTRREQLRLVAQAQADYRAWLAARAARSTFRRVFGG